MEKFHPPGLVLYTALFFVVIVTKNDSGAVMIRSIGSGVCSGNEVRNIVEWNGCG